MSRTLAVGAVVLMVLVMVVPIIAVHLAKKHCSAQRMIALHPRTVGEVRAGE
jgi:hypothetical protein